MPSVESHSELISFIQGHSPDSPVDLPCLHSLVAEVDLHSPLGHADNDQGYSVLHYAVLTGNGSLVKELLLLGHPWNAVSCNGISVGDLAREKGFNDLYADLVEEGARAELLLTAMGMSCRKYVDQDEDEDVEAPPNAEYLSSPLTYSEGRLLDADKNAVMMGWEEPLMVIHAKVIAPTPGKKVLNVGFGLGIIDMALQKLSPSEHTIIEAHPDVYKKMIQDGWDKKPGVKIIFGRWQDVMDQLEVYDGIFFDTFGEYYDDLKEFHDHVPNILSDDGVYSYFNGLGGTNQFFHDVSNRVAECDLADMGLKSEYITLDMDTLGNEVWQGTKRAYWSLRTYKIPICRMDPSLFGCIDG